MTLCFSLSNGDHYFILFGELPQELQIKVWEYVAAHAAEFDLETDGMLDLYSFSDISGLYEASTWNIRLTCSGGYCIPACNFGLCMKMYVTREIMMGISFLARHVAIEILKEEMQSIMFGEPAYPCLPVFHEGFFVIPILKRFFES